jgi:hypothetical protein
MAQYFTAQVNVPLTEVTPQAIIAWLESKADFACNAKLYSRECRFIEAALIVAVTCESEIGPGAPDLAGRLARMRALALERATGR